MRHLGERLGILVLVLRVCSQMSGHETRFANLLVRSLPRVRERIRLLLVLREIRWRLVIRLLLKLELLFVRMRLGEGLLGWRGLLMVLQRRWWLLLLVSDLFVRRRL